MTIRRILRFDLSDDEIENTRFEVANSGNGQSFAALQLGPDDRIYVARSNGANFLSAINNPDEEDPLNLNFINQAINLNSLSTLGLPNDWNFNPSLIDETVLFEEVLCEGDEALLHATYYDGASYLWDSGQQTQERTIDNGGVFTVEISHPCFTRTETFFIEEIEKPQFEILGSTEFCEDQASEIEIITDAEILWWDGDSNLLRTFTTSGTYSYYLQNEECSFEENLIVNTEPLPEIVFEQDIYEKCQGERIQINPEVQHEDSLFWDRGSVQRTLEVLDPGLYSLTAINACGIAREQIEVVEETCDCDVYIPNAFSPNGDGLNDNFRPVCDCEFLMYKLEVFNRWGQIVFESTDPERTWNGSIRDNSHYSEGSVFSYNLVGTVSKNSRRRAIEQKGFVTLVR
jgi:gliding motility-associated-like protein